jgi:DNA-binding PadR family transcriptional regulator
MNVQSILLGFLMLKSMTGYEMRQIFSISFSFFSDLSYGSIYPALKRMERDGLITMQLEIQDGAPNRKVYSITDAGRKAFMEALSAPVSLERAKQPFLMRLFFFSFLPPEQRQTIATNHLESIQAVHRQLEEARPQIEGRADRFQYLCFEFGLRFFRDLAENVSEVIRGLEEEKNQDTV